MTVTQTWNTTELVAKDKAHLLHPVSNLKTLREKGPLILAHGEGVYLWDTDGKRYIDGFAGLWNVNVGHGRHELAEAAAEQIDEVAFVPNFFGLASPPSIELAAKLASMFPGDLNHMQFTSGGAESNETALKMARYYWWLKGKPEKIKIISRKMGYHGIAMGALAATGIPTYHEGFGPGVPGYVHVSPPYKYRNGEGLSDEEFVGKLIAELEELIAREGAETIAAFIGEPVQGAGGVVVPVDGYWQAVRELLTKHNILLIADEVICGFGRTGSMFGAVEYHFQPDIASFAKGVTSGYIPLGGVAVSDTIFDVMSEPDRMFMHGFTYSGHPVACAVALRNIDIIEREDLPTNARETGDHLRAELDRLVGDHKNVGEIRGKGQMTIVELVANRETKEKLDPSTNPSGMLTAATRKQGVIVRPTDLGIGIAPPLTITKQEATTLAEGVAAAIHEVYGE
ncbi:MAG: aspartate aminotransferase family protein [Thermomicrobiales bacterium]